MLCYLRVHRAQHMVGWFIIAQLTALCDPKGQELTLSTASTVPRDF